MGKQLIPMYTKALTLLTIIGMAFLISAKGQAPKKTVQQNLPRPNVTPKKMPEPRSSVNFISAPWDTVKAMAKKRGMPIFVFFYSSGCDHCEREMATVLTDKNLGVLINSRFISTKIEAGSAEAKPLIELYKLYLYPSFILFDKDGLILHVEEGELPVTELTQFANKIDIPNKCLYVLKRAYDGGNHSMVNCYNYALAACYHDKEAATKAFKEYFNQQNDSITSVRNWVLISHMSYSAELPGFQILKSNKQAFAAIYSDTLVNHYLYEGAISTISYAADRREASFYDAARGAFDGCKDTAYLSKYYKAVLYYFTKMQKRDSFVLYADKYLEPHLWTDEVYITSTARRLLDMTNTAADYARCDKWLKRAMALNPKDCRVYDAYTRLLMRQGKREQAIQMVKQGVQVGKENDCDLFPLYGLCTQLGIKTE